MAAHFPHGDHLAFVFCKHFSVAQDHIPHFHKSWSRQQLPCFQIMGDAFKDPGISLGSSAYHDTVTACFIQQPFRVLRSKYIPVSDHRYLYCLFYLADNIPVCFSGIILFSGAPVDCHCRYAAAFCHFGKLYCIDALVVKAFAEFYSHRLFHSLYHGSKHFFRLGGIFHQGRAFMVVDDLRHRASHIYINGNIGPVLDLGCDLCHYFWVRAEKLHRYRTFCRVYSQKLFCVFIFV